MLHQGNFPSPLTTKTKALMTGGVTLFVFSMLLWDHFHGGIPSHHILYQENLPAISNWWSGLFLPILTWFLLTRVEKRLAKQQVQQPNKPRKRAIQLFITGLVLGTSIAISFEHGYSFFLDHVLYIIVILSLIIPIYYAEFILGFVLAMTYTFGAILPTAFILVLAVTGLMLYRFVRPALQKVVPNKLQRSQNN